MTLLRRWRITTRIVAIALIGVAVAATMVATAVNGFGEQRTSNTTTLGAMRLSRLALEAKFRTADVAGWQTGYAFDFNRGVPGAADDTVGQRKEFLASGQALKALYAQLGQARLTPAQASLLATARAAFDKFLTVDTAIVAGYRTGTEQAVTASNELASGASLEAFGIASQATGDLAAKIGEAGETAATASTESARHGQRMMWITGLIGLMLLIASTTVIIRSIASPLSALWHGLADIAEGEADLRHRLAEAGHDELTMIAAAFNRFVAGMAQTVRSVGERAAALSTKSTELTEVAGSLAVTAADAAGRAASATQAAEEISRNVQTVAAGTEQMGSSITEIARSTHEASQVASEANTVVRTVNATVSELGESSREIGQVAHVITSIAEQTNLLALNATIEAARAGEAGKGFAVVASEVKDLAQATATATENISARIDAIQASTASAIGAIGQITEVMDRINELQTIVASAIEEQSATTTEMGRSVAEAAAGSTGIARDMAAVTGTANLTTGRVDEIRGTADGLAGLAGELTHLVDRFRY